MTWKFSLQYNSFARKLDMYFYFITRECLLWLRQNEQQLLAPHHYQYVLQVQTSGSPRTTEQEVEKAAQVKVNNVTSTQIHRL